MAPSASRAATPSNARIRCATLPVGPFPPSDAVTGADGRVDRKILDMLPDRPPQVSFSCDASSATCQFQFWIGGVESFYCALDDCAQSIDVGPEGKNNVTKAVCDTMKCKCVPGKMLCGESGSVGTPSCASTRRPLATDALCHRQTSATSFAKRSKGPASSRVLPMGQAAASKRTL